MQTIVKQSGIIILDFGSQYTQLIGRRIRELNVYCEIYPYHVDPKSITTIIPCGFILSGSPASATNDDVIMLEQWVLDYNLPILGICYGMQSLAKSLGGTVEKSTHREYGQTRVKVCHPSKLLTHIEDSINEEGQACLSVWMSHGDKVNSLPPGFEIICQTENAPIAGMAHTEKPWYGLQFHPEVTHTLQGIRILENYVVNICQAPKHWTAANIVDDLALEIKTTIGDERVLLALSGGVDSSVVAALLHKAIGDNLTCIFVDTGLLRLNEGAQVMQMFDAHLGIHVIKVDAEEIFLTALKGITCPELKRKKIGNTFIEIFDTYAQQLNGIQWLAQGTIYPDIIESAGHGAHSGTVLIKSHHNVGGLPEKMNLKLIEPIRNLFKDEVRKIGLELGLPREMIYRHPFPGPGLGVRILGEVKKEYADILRHADYIFIDELKKASLYHQISQAFAVFLPIKSVGVMGDERNYNYVIGLRAVETVDFMTAHWSELPWDFLAKVSSRIINEVQGVSRVVYDVSGKPPATIEWE